MVNKGDRLRTHKEREFVTEIKGDIMSRRRKDKFIQDVGRINRARRHRRTQRAEKRRNAESQSRWQMKWEDFQDGWEFQKQEFGALGREVGRAVNRETWNVRKGFLKREQTLSLTSFLLWQLWVWQTRLLQLLADIEDADDGDDSHNCQVREGPTSQKPYVKTE